MTELVEKLRCWSYRRQLLGKRASSAVKALDKIVFINGSITASALSLHARVRSFQEKDLANLDDTRIVLRISAMRGSVVMVSAENAAQLHSAAGVPGTHIAKEERRREKKYQDLREIVEKVAISPLSAVEISDAVGIPSRNILPVIRRMMGEGKMVAVGSKNVHLHSLGYVSTASWTKCFPPVEKRKALEWLAGKYLRTYGPARVSDFKWWSGISKECALRAISDNDAAEIENGYFILKEDVQSFQRTKPDESDHMDLVPITDGVLTGYAPDGRGRFIEKKFLRRINTKLGTGFETGVVLINGSASGIWGMKFSGSDIRFVLKTFEKISENVRSKIFDELNEIGHLFQAKHIRIDRLT